MTQPGPERFAKNNKAQEKCSLSDYDYYLPEELIAQRPLKRRDKSRMLVLDRRDGKRTHTTFDRLPRYLKAGDLLVLNNTRVIPVRLNGRIAGRSGEAEILLLHRTEDEKWMAMVKPGRKLKPGAKVIIERDIAVLIEDYGPEGLRKVSISAPGTIEDVLRRAGRVPLPPYIKAELEDSRQYQTIYAEENGSAAAPTAGFHFTRAVFAALEEKGVRTAFITLHIGPGTFQPVKTADIRDHSMHYEYYSLSEDIARLLNTARKEGRRIIAVGTTVCRVLETVVNRDGSFNSREEGWTGLYIYPGFEFRAIDGLITNFHLPHSTLLMLVCAFAGYEETMAAYREAVEKRYRFYSFGDCMLID